MDPDDEGDPASKQLFNGTCSTYQFFTTTISCSLLFFSCHVPPDEKIIRAIAAKKDTAHTKPPVTVTTAKPKKKIYLSFDDGPNKGTPVLLNILEEEKVPATLFLIGEQVYGSRTQAATWNRLKQSGTIELANHSYTHAHNKFVSYYNDSVGVVQDFIRCRDSLRLSNNISRTPGRNIWRIGSLSVTDIGKTKPAADAVQQAGFTLVGWDLEWHYTPPNLLLRESPEEMLYRIDSLIASGKTRNKDHLILLAHDQTFEDHKDSASLRWLIRQIRQRDEYELDIISNYPGITPLPVTR